MTLLESVKGIMLGQSDAPCYSKVPKKLCKILRHTTDIGSLQIKIMNDVTLNNKSDKTVTYQFNRQSNSFLVVAGDPGTMPRDMSSDEFLQLLGCNFLVLDLINVGAL